jgi:small subunit ribosomal protein S6
VPNYECAVVFTATFTDEQMPDQIDVVKNWLAGIGANITAVDVWGRRRLAYNVRKQREGYYVIYYFAMDGNQSRMPEVEKRFNTSEAILCHMIVKLPSTLKETQRVPREEEEEAAAPAETTEEAPAEGEAAPAEASEPAPAEGEAVPAEAVPVEATEAAPEEAPPAQPAAEPAEAPAEEKVLPE